jgi:hypothetical protein
VILIAFTGPAGAGKDSAGEVLATYARFQRMAFAEPLRAEVLEAFDIQSRPALLLDRATKEQPHDALALRHCSSFCFIGAVAIATRACVSSEWLDAPRSPRQILQWWGTEYRRAQDPDYWIKAMASRVRVAGQNGLQRIAITDCRFENELAYIRSVGGRLWRLQRPELEAVEGGHESAIALRDKPADVEIRNAGTLQDLRNQVLRHWWATDSGIAVEQLQVEVTA